MRFKIEIIFVHHYFPIYRTTNTYLNVTNILLRWVATVELSLRDTRSFD
jgi:hypothetical protein